MANISQIKTPDGTTYDIKDANAATESYVDTGLASKQNTITGAATTVTSSNLTASRVLISNTSGKISAASGVTTTEIGYVAGLDRKVMGFYSHKSYDTSVSVDNMRGVSGQYEYNGSYWMNRNDWSGMPGSNSYGYLEVMGNMQRFTNYSSSGSSVVYTRTYANSTWTAWKRIGSGVDASVSGTTLTLSSV